MRKMLIFAFSLNLAVQVSGLDRYVATNGLHDAGGGFADWAGAATNIQMAVDAAEAGDTIWVSNGTWQVTTQIAISKGITLRSWSGNPADTLLVGGYPSVTNRLVYMNHADALVQGFTITNGFGPENNYYGRGGGAYIVAGVLKQCHVIGCLSTNVLPSSSWNYGRGGGVHASGVNSLVTGCRVEGNIAYQRGGGVNLEDGARLENSLILLNETLKNPDITQGGGGVMIVNSQMENCTIISNVAHEAFGGGASMNGNGVIVRNCLFAGNSAPKGGGGLSSGTSGTHIYNFVQNCTLTDNSSGIYVTFHKGAALWCENTISFGNTGANFHRNIYGGGAQTFFQYSCIQVQVIGDLPQGDGNLDLDPLFENPAGGNFRLQSGSPCIDAGTNQSWMVGARDLDGVSRIDRVSGLVDMGCYEYLPSGSLFLLR